MGIFGISKKFLLKASAVTKSVLLLKPKSSAISDPWDAPNTGVLAPLTYPMTLV
jgi:hypothetical protein